MKQKILIADDEPAVRTLVARAIGSERYDILTAADGDDALCLAAQQAPDLIVLDVDMPKKTGWQVLDRLRRGVQTRITPIIMLTGCAAVADEVFGLDSGADDYVTKPFSPADLKARISSALRRMELGVSANPLTKLPGNPSIEEEVNRRIRHGLGMAFLYVDIDHFKPYNDNYGFAAGDKVIRDTAGILLESLAVEAGGDGLVGHIGGDDFVVITEPGHAPRVARRIVSRFDRAATGFYRTSDKARGFIESNNRQGLRQRFPLMSLSIGIATSERRKLDHYAKVVQIASEMKAFCKANPDRRLSRFAFDRRREPEHVTGQRLARPISCAPWPERRSK